MSDDRKHWLSDRQLLELRIGELLREHECGYSKEEGFHCVSILCDWTGHDLDFPEHQADVIISELGMRQEWSNAYQKQGDGGVWRDERTAPFDTPNIPTANQRVQTEKPVDWMRDMRIESRWVTGWEDTEGKTP